MKKILLGLLCSIALSLSSGVYEAGAQDFGIKQQPSVEESQKTLGVLAGYLYGKSTYHISYYEGPSGIESELEFPLQTFMAGLEGGYSFANYRKQREFRLHARWLTNIGSGSGKMKDSDWLTDDLDITEVGSPHPGKDIYSESDIKLKANIIDISAAFNTILENKMYIGPLLGYKYEKFHFDVSNTNQVGYGPYAHDYTGYISGKTLDYEVTYNILYLGVNFDYLRGGDFQANCKLGYSPWTSVKDTDDHLLRYKLSKGDTKGQTFFVSLGAQWDIDTTTSLQLGGEYMTISTKGTQTQTFYAGPYEGSYLSVDDKITSSQLLFTAMLTFRFSD